jgi:hypothetical protein
MFGIMFVNQPINMFKVIILSIFVVLGVGSWFFIMIELFRNIFRRLKEKKDV